MNKVIIVMPAYYAAKTLEATLQSLPRIYDEIILCDDASRDETAQISRRLGIVTIRHEKNRGYGGNQKTLYREALARGAAIIVMVHPDNQYDTACAPDMIAKIRAGEATMVLGSRMLTARKHGMPLWKFIPNRFLSFAQNAVLRTHLSEFHSGLRAYDARAIAAMPFDKFSDDFVFDSEVIAWMVAHGYRIGEVPTRCFYGGDVSSISFRRSVTYGLATLRTLWRFGRGHYKRLEKNGVVIPSPTRDPS